MSPSHKVDMLDAVVLRTGPCGLLLLGVSIRRGKPGMHFGILDLGCLSDWLQLSSRARNGESL